MGLELTRINIPSYKLHGESALLECQYNLNTNKNTKSNGRTNYNRYDRNSGYRMHSSDGFEQLLPNDSDDEMVDEKQRLYSVKWYKDNEEFYRYVPKSNPPQQSYRVEGIRVDVSTAKNNIILS